MVSFLRLRGAPTSAKLTGSFPLAAVSSKSVRFRQITDLAENLAGGIT